MSDGKQAQLKRHFEEDPINEYQGYTWDKSNPSIERVECTITAKDFFERFISKRRPCIVVVNQSVSAITPNLICEVAGDCEVQVEKRLDEKQTYGQNRTNENQIKCKINEFWKYLQNDTDRELYYLSTQQSDDTFSTPCRQLLDLNHIPQTLEWAGALLLESCNLWWGASKESNSGLHHDFHDNFYLVQSGIKRFRLFPPSTKIAVYGEIEKIHPNGLISYRDNPTRADGFPLLKRTKLDQNESSDEEDNENEVLIGKGFDYESDDDSDNLHRKEDMNDDYDDFVGHDEIEEDEAGEESVDGSSDDKSVQPSKSRPNNFSPLDPEHVNEPGLTIEVRSGECLYLPCGWFHHVTSLRATDDSHLALNYWYHPPDSLHSFANPYFHRHDLCSTNQ